MLAELVHWVWIALVSLGYGSVFLLENGEIKIGSQSLFGRLWLQSVAGLGVLCTLSLVLNFWLPLGGMLSATVGLFGIVLGVYLKGYRGLGQFKGFWHWGALGGAVFTGLACLLKAAAPSSYTDFGIYYIQFMRWAEQYAIVPGLANLHVRLAFNSTWHLVAILLNPFASQVALDGINEYLLLGTLCYFVFDPLGQKKGLVSAKSLFLAVLVLALSIVYLKVFLAEPTADLAVVLMVWLLVDILLPLANPAILKTSKSFWLPLFLASVLVTIKVSALPTLWLVGLVLLAQPKFWKLFYLGSLPLAIVGLWVVRTWILSGYPICPVPMHLPASLVPDWQVPIDQIQEAYLGVQGFARYHITNVDEHLYNYAQICAMPLSSWLPMWLRQKDLADWFVLSIEGLSLLVITVRVLQKKYTLGERLLFLGLVASLGYWFLAAPGVRFVICYFVPLLTLAIQTFNWPRVDAWVPRLSHGVLVVLGFTFLVVCRDVRVLKTYSILPASWPVVQVAQSAKGPYVYPISVYADGSLGQCWDAPLPCAEFDVLKIQLRGKTLQEGFKPAR